MLGKDYISALNIGSSLLKKLDNLEVSDEWLQERKFHKNISCV